MLTYGMIIRFHYDEDDPRFKWRLAYFKSHVLLRIKRQTNKGFDVCIRCNPAHDDIFKKLGCKTFHIKDEYVTYVQSKRSRKRFFHDFVPWSRVEGLPQYDVQMGLDSDDLIHKDYISRIKREVNLWMKKYPNKSLHLSFQPEIFDLRTKTKKRIRSRYSPTAGSAFFALYQPDKTKYHFCYEISHELLWKLVRKSITIPSGYCWATVHGLNESTTR